MASASGSTALSVVLVHGGFVDGSGWEGVYQILRKHGYPVSIVQNPTISHADDVAVTRRVIAAQNGPVILVGHSYGGAVITEAGNDPKVAALAHIILVRPGQGRVGRLAHQRSAAGSSGPADTPSAGRLSPPRQGQVPRLIRWRRGPGQGRVHGRLPGPVGRGRSQRHDLEPAFRTKPSWYLRVTDDQMIPLPAQRFMSERAGATTVEVPGSHSIYVSRPDAVAALIERAAKEVSASARTAA